MVTSIEFNIIMSPNYKSIFHQKLNSPNFRPSVELATSNLTPNQLIFFDYNFTLSDVLIHIIHLKGNLQHQNNRLSYRCFFICSFFFNNNKLTWRTCWWKRAQKTGKGMYITSTLSKALTSSISFFCLQKK